MLHVATVHFRSPRWMSIQARELHRHLNVPYLTWASLEGVDPSFGRCFDRNVEQAGSHAEKLNRLAREISTEADRDDLLMFLDGDAFPIADPLPLIESGLAAAPLMAVRRAENFDDPQPHPCFCVTRVGTWTDLEGDWSPGPTWPGPEGEQVTDIGADLLLRLERAGMPWTQVLRTNRHDLHPLFFGIYGDAIYHHGAGFRPPVTRADIATIAEAGLSDPAEARKAIQAQVARNRHNAEALFERIRRDDPDWLADLPQR